MASARQSAAAASTRPALRAVELSRPSNVCRVHTCMRCQCAIQSAEPCSFVASAASVCRLCSQQQVISHLPAAPSNRAANLATFRRTA